MIRGGSWNNPPRNVRSAYRNRNDSDNRNNNVGFRLTQYTRMARSGAVHGQRRRGAGVHEPDSRPRRDGIAE